MASSISSIDSLMTNLAPTFQTTIKAIIEAESAPLNQVKAQKDSLELRRGVFNDLKTNFDSLQNALKALISTEASYGLKMTPKLSVTPALAGSAVATASLSAETAPTADYSLAVSQLAKAHSLASAAVASPDLALGKSGTFWMGGTGVADLQTETSPGVYSPFVAAGSLTAASTALVASGQRELGTGTYTLQVRDSAGVRQFRLVNADSNPVSLRKTDGSNAFTADWQAMPSGAYDTGRGQTLTFNPNNGLESVSFYYTARGTSLQVSATDTQRSLMNAINAAEQPEGRHFTAAIVANQLTLTAAQTGENHGMVFSDGAGLGFNTLLQSAQNAQFTLNGMSVSRASNTGLTDVLEGVTLNLAGDAEGKSALLSISASADKATSLVNTFVSQFNSTLTHLKGKLSATAKTDGANTTYTRGPLTGDTMFSALRADMLHSLGRTYSGDLTRLEDLGLTIDKDMKLTLDSAKLSQALSANPKAVSTLLDAAMGKLNTALSRYTGSQGYITRSLASIESQQKSYDARMEKYNASLSLRKESLYYQYLEYQNQIADLGRTAQWLGISLGTSVDTSG